MYFMENANDGDFVEVWYTSYVKVLKQSFKT